MRVILTMALALTGVLVLRQQAHADGAVPPNDLCVQALDIALGESVDFDTTDAGTDGPPTADCFFAADQIVRDIWYRFTAPADAVRQRL